MVEPLRHRQTKEAATDMFCLKPPRHISTLHLSDKRTASTFVAYWTNNGQGAALGLNGPAANDPNVWSGRALQESLSSWRCAVLHQCIRPLIGACCAPGHHGYQRACDLISGKASSGPFGSPVFACAGKTEPPSRFILSQTSAGRGYRATSSRVPHLSVFISRWTIKQLGRLR